MELGSISPTTILRVWYLVSAVVPSVLILAISFRVIDSLLGQKDALVAELSDLRKEAAIAAKRIEVLVASVEFLGLPRETQLAAKQYADDLQHQRDELAEAKRIEKASLDADQLLRLRSLYPDFFVPKNCGCGGEFTYHPRNFPVRLSSGWGSVLATRYCANCRSSEKLMDKSGGHAGI